MIDVQQMYEGANVFNKVRKTTGIIYMNITDA